MENNPEEIESPESQEKTSLLESFNQYILKVGNEAEANYGSGFGSEVFGPATDSDRRNAKFDAMSIAANKLLTGLLGSSQSQNNSEFLAAVSKDIAMKILTEEDNSVGATSSVGLELPSDIIK